MLPQRKGALNRVTGQNKRRYTAPSKREPFVSINYKTPEQIQGMRVAGKLAAEVLTLLDDVVKPGVSTGAIDKIVHDHIVDVQGGIPATLGYHGFPASCCTSINHVVCHGIPADDKILKDGDIVNIDVTVIKDGFHGDTSKMYFVGKPRPHLERLVRITQECMYMGIEQVKPGARLGDIGFVIQQHAEKNNYSVVREYCGHGIGQVFHEDPQILHYGRAGHGTELKPGMCFTIEPMINLGNRQVRLLGDDWTVITKDRKHSAQWEHTLAVTDTGYEIFTYRENEETFPRLSS